MKVLFAGVTLASLVAVPAVVRSQPSTTVSALGQAGISAPNATHKIRPRYTDAARAAGIQGSLTVECVVMPDGSVADAQVTKSLDAGLDEEALQAIRQWRFDPGRKDGIPVAVKVSVEFTFTLKAARAAGSLFPVPAPTSAASALAAPDPVYRAGGNISAPVAITRVRAGYDASAMADKVQGVVTLDCVVLPDGSVGDVHVTRSLDARLDGAAVKALKQWKFEPGRKDGKPVAVLVSIEMTFTLR